MNPENYLDSYARVELMAEVRRLVWRHYRRWLSPAFIGVLGLALALGLSDIWQGLTEFTAGLGAFVIGILGVLAGRSALPEGIRSRYYDLLWASAVARQVHDRTLLIDSILPPLLRERRRWRH